MMTASLKGNLRSPKRRRKLVYCESPLISSSASCFGNSTSNEMGSNVGRNQKKVSKVTPSPALDDTVLRDSPSTSSTGCARNLFRVTSNSKLDGIEEIAQSQKCDSEVMTPSPVRRRLFETSHRSRLRKAKKSNCEHPLFGIKSWESVASVASLGSSMPKESSRHIRSSAKDASPPTHILTNQFRGKKDSPTKAKNRSRPTFTPELVSLLAPKPSIPHSKQLPMSVDDVLNRVAFQRKEQKKKEKKIHRSSLPRQCKAQGSAFRLLEESDDDLYFDSIQYPVGNASKHPTEVSKKVELKSSQVPVQDVPPTKRKRGRPRKNSAEIKRGKTSVKGNPEQSKAGRSSPSKDHKLSNLPTRKRGRPAKYAKKSRTFTDASKQQQEKRHSLRKTTRQSVSENHSMQTAEDNINRRRHHQEHYSKGEDDVQDTEHPTLERTKHRRTHEAGSVVKKVSSTSRETASKAKKSKSHKVRFAPTTTTFSLEIRVKTSAHSSKRGKRKKLPQPKLSQAAVQTIASQITEAYLTQGHSDDHSPQFEDVQDDNNFASGSSTSSESHDSVISTEPKKRCNTRQEIILDDGNEDSQSVTSEITMDIDLIKADREARRHQRNQFLAKNDDGDDENNEDDNDNNEINDPDIFHKDNTHSFEESLEAAGRRRKRRSRQLSTPGHNSSTSLVRTQDSSYPSSDDDERIGKKQIHESSTSPILEKLDDLHKPLERQSKRRRMKSTDSLAGESLASIYSEKNDRLRSSSSQSPKDKRKKMDLKKDQTNSQTAISKKEKKRIFQANGRCNHCSGCRQSIDCLTCSKCLEALQSGSIIHGTGTGCLKRICRMTRLCARDTLAKTCRPVDSSVGGMREEGALPRDNVKVPAVSSQDDDDDDNDNDDGDNCSRSSHGSLGGSIYSSTSKLRRSRAARVWSRRWAKERENLSRSRSVASATSTGTSTVAASALGVSSKGIKRKGKRTKSYLHDLELPVDGSVASARERRRSLYALMKYDEADQDWI